MWDSSILWDLLPFIAVGFAAQIVDGALGMAFGVISTTLLPSWSRARPKLLLIVVGVLLTLTSFYGISRAVL